MALKACDNHCSLSNLYRRLNKIADNIRKDNLNRLLITGREERSTSDDDCSRRKLFTSPPSEKTVLSQKRIVQLVLSHNPLLQ